MYGKEIMGLHREFYTSDGTELVEGFITQDRGGALELWHFDLRKGKDKIFKSLDLVQRTSSVSQLCLQCHLLRRASIAAPE